MVPKGWIASQIGDIAKFSSGGTPSKQNAHFWGGTEPWISGKDLKTHYLATSIDTLTEDGFKVAKKAPKGSSLILVRGMTLLKDFPVGYATREVAFNQDLKALIPNENIDGLFLSFILAAEKNKILKLVSTAGHGTGRLDTESIKAYPVNIPPHSEQNKIAKILSTWDRAISTAEQLLTNSQQQKKALMQQLLTGKKRLMNKNGIIFCGKWKHGNLSELGKVIKGKALSSKDLMDGNYPVIAGGKSSPYSHKEFTHENAITVSASGAYAGYVAYHPYKFWASDCSVVTSKSNSDILFIYQLMSHMQLKIYSLQSGGAQPHIYPKDIEALSVNIPPIEEQEKISIVLSIADKEIAVLQQKLAALKQEKKALMQQLLTGKRRVKVEAAA